jgi:hypothetical protein
VRLWGQIETPFEDDEFSYKDYLAHQRIHSLKPFAAADRLVTGQGNPVLRALFAFRKAGLDLIYTYYPAPEV